MEDRLQPLDTEYIAKHYLGAPVSTVRTQVSRGRFPRSDYAIGHKVYWFKGTADAWRDKLIAGYERTKEQTQKLVTEIDPKTGKCIGIKNKTEVNAIRFAVMEEATVHAEEVGAILKAQLLNERRDGDHASASA
jgi:hypothetical protein